MTITQDRTTATAWARGVLADPQTVILDTETTGLDYRAQVVQIAVIDTAGAVLLNTLVRPTEPIPPAASRIHGIVDQMVAGAPAWPEILPFLRPVLHGRRVVIYNAAYDKRILRQSCQAHGLDSLGLFPVAYECAMEWYAQWYGEWNSYWQSYRWQPLAGGDHSALGDCRACLAALQRMAASDD
jgi:DNA polymerase-3 subunit epsilon